MQRLIIQVNCPDQPGIVARVAGLISELGGNILGEESHREPAPAKFFMRLDIDVSKVAAVDTTLKPRLAELAQQLDGQAEYWDAAERQRVAILVTSEESCAVELLSRQRAGRLHCEIPLVIGSRLDLAEVVAAYKVPFQHVAATDQAAHEQEVLQQLEKAQIDLVVLARYMRILSPQFIARYPGRIINIHHSFLPAFKGAKPYQQAWERGVKVIGATAHYATAELDDGPIIAQDVVAVDHWDSPAALTEKGRSVEQRVLAAAVTAHLEHRIMVHGRRTVVFR
ncbi:MAG TPA: formyltetrahydrofolate deformylase [Candidatus Saccharimonadales bacterium]|nr:formyltetrahydrofolate deformylase [Candidatus Saccharimonadales bacterium]